MKRVKPLVWMALWLLCGGLMGCGQALAATPISVVGETESTRRPPRF